MAPHSLAKRPRLDVGELDAHILQTEQRLVARQQALGRSVNALGRRVRHTLRPQRLALAVAGGAFLLLATGWWLGRKGRAAVPSRALESSSTGEPSWTRLIPLLLPLLPPGWRDRAGPAAAALALGPSLLGRHRGPPPRTVDQVDLGRYAGTWFEIARLPAPFEGACTGQPTATYVPRGDHIEVLNRCPGPGGRMREAHGVARVVPGSAGARLKVSLLPRWLRWLPGAWADYWILHLDADYNVALVGSPGRHFLWVLARQRCLPEQELQALVDIGRAQGFPVEQLQVVQPG
jgi:apolipoprotein D and lipocalin family protein